MGGTSSIRGRANHEPMLSIVVLTLGGPTASETLGVEPGQHLDPGGSAFWCSFWPGVPDGALNESVDVFREVVGEGAAERG